MAATPGRHPLAGTRRSPAVPMLCASARLAGMLVIPTCQQAGLDLVQMGERVEGEKDRLLERVRAAALATAALPPGRLATHPLPCRAHPAALPCHTYPAPSPSTYGRLCLKQSLRACVQFMEFASVVCECIIRQGHWADYIDPCSGLPMLNRETNSVYGEVEALSTLLGYRVQNAGCCKASERAARGLPCRAAWASSLPRACSPARPRERERRGPPCDPCRLCCTRGGAAPSTRPASLPRPRWTL